MSTLVAMIAGENDIGNDCWTWFDGAAGSVGVKKCYKMALLSPNFYRAISNS